MKGLCIALFEKPSNKQFSVAAWDTMKEVREELGELEKRLAGSSPIELLELFKVVVFLSPLIVRLENQKELERHIDKSGDYVQIHNPFRLPTYTIQINESIRQLVIFDIYEFFKNKYAKGVNVE